MLAVRFASADSTTVHATAVLAAVTNHAIPVDEARSVCGGKYKIQVGDVTGICMRIPDGESFGLKRSEMVHAWKEERVDILGLVGARNKATWANVDFAIMFVRG